MTWRLLVDIVSFNSHWKHLLLKSIPIFLSDDISDTEYYPMSIWCPSELNVTKIWSIYALIGQNLNGKWSWTAANKVQIFIISPETSRRKPELSERKFQKNVWSQKKPKHWFVQELSFYSENWLWICIFSIILNFSLWSKIILAISGSENSVVKSQTKVCF